MFKRVAYVYKWATMGGVERVLLNRAEAFKAQNSDALMSVNFLHDSGGRLPFEDYIKRRGLMNHIRVVDCLEHDNFDVVVSIDTPEVLDNLPRNFDRLAFECHTHYENNRRYLKTIPGTVRWVAVPSETFRKTVERENGDFGGKLCLLRNFLPEVDPPRLSIKAPAWTKRPVVYVGRIDHHKNLTELMDALVIYRERYGDDLLLVVIGPVADEVDMRRELAQRELSGRTVMYPPAAFDRVAAFLEMVRERGGIFVSCSQGETFALSAAEAIAARIPPVLSNIDAHRHLVDGLDDHLYPLGFPDALAERIFKLSVDYDASSSKLIALRDRFGSATFVSDWNALQERFA